MAITWDMQNVYLAIGMWKNHFTKLLLGKKKKKGTHFKDKKKVQTLPLNKLIKLALAQLASQLQLIKDLPVYVVSDS